MHSNKLTKYKIGLAVIGLFTLIILILVLVEAGPTRDDSNTYNKANDIANKLNSYVENNGFAPTSLATIGEYNVPSTISYTKLSDTSYRFCVDYKTTSDNFNASEAETNLILSEGHSTQGFNQDQSADSDGFLLLGSSHHKGNNCQTVSLFGITSPELNFQTE